MRQGQDLVIGGFIGLKGTIYAAEHLGGQLQRALPRALLREAAGFRRELERVPEEAVKAGFDKGMLRNEGDLMVSEPVGEGGVLAALWNMAERYQTGLTVYLRQIPIHQETIEICEALELNPYGLLSGGCTLFAANHGNDLLRCLGEAGIHGAVIGKVTEGQDRLLIHGEVRSYLNRPAPDEIEKWSGKRET